MSYGFEVRNGSGRMIVDGDRQNYFLVLRRSASVTLSEVVDNYYHSTMFYTPKVVYFPTPLTTQTPPLLFMRHTGGEPVSIVKMNGAPGNWYGFDVLINCWFGVQSDSGQKSTSFEYELYITADDAVAVAKASGYYFASDYGVVVYDGGGATVFDSRIANLAITNFEIIHTGIPQDQAGSGVGASGNPYTDQEPYEGRLLFNIPGNNLIDAQTLMSAFGAAYPLKPFLVGSQLKLQLAANSPKPPRAGRVAHPWTGSQNKVSFPMMSCRRQAI